MTKMERATASVLLGLTVACAAPARETVDTARVAADRAAVDQGHEAFLNAMRGNNVDSLRPLIAEEAEFAPPNANIGAGREAFLTWYQQLLTQMRTSGVTVSDRDVAVAGDLAIESGTFDWTLTPVAGGAPVRDQGHFIAIWRRQPDGGWKATRLIWNSSQPLPGTAPAR